MKIQSFGSRVMLKYFMLFIALICVPPTASAEWVSVVYNGIGTVYLDFSTRESFIDPAILEKEKLKKSKSGESKCEPCISVRTGRLIKMMLMFEHDKAIDVIRGSPSVKSMISLKEFDCTQRQMRSKWYELYSGSKGSGQLVSRKEDVDVWTFPNLGQTDEYVLKVACEIKD